ncbi:MAG TPA: hypothetical protein VK698_11360 [Kofleriaceae bacterium]|nr:hypothetical protein [Kofleriaceae bacterium]
MWSRARRTGVAMAALAAAVAVFGRAPDAHARPRKAYWMVSFLGGALLPLGETADERELGLGVGMRVGYTTRIGLGVALTAQYSPLPVTESDDPTADDVVDNNFVSAALVPRYTLGRGALRLSIGAGGGVMLERTTSRPAGDDMAETNTVSVFAASGVGELGLETYLWDSGGLVLTGSYLRSFGERESEIASVLGGLVFTFR